MTQQHAVDPIACFLTACEIERREHRSVRREHKVAHGRLVSAEKGRFFYSFRAPPGFRLREDSSVQLIVEGVFYHGIVCAPDSGPAVVSQSSQVESDSLEQWFTIATQADLGPEIPSARVEGLEHDLLQSLILRLRALRGHSRALDWNSELAKQVLGLKLQKAPGQEDRIPVDFAQDLTAEQVSAIQRSLCQPVTYLWGPPGTGKTVTLAALALRLFQDNKRVLVVSHTNHAVDGVVESLCKRITERGRTAIPEGSILRVGTLVRESLIDRYGSQVHLESVIQRNQAKVSVRLNDLRRELVGVRDSLFAVGRKISLFDAREGLLRELERLQGDAAGFDAEFLAAVLRSLDPQATVSNPVAASALDQQTHETVALVQNSLERIAEEISGYDRGDLQEQSLELSGRQLEITEAVAVLEKYLRDLRLSLLDRARIVATTATQAMLAVDDLHRFDAVLIDEASMLPLPLCFLLTGLARERVVLAGDFRQLPAIALSDAEIVRDWYSRDIFECAGVVDCVDQKRAHPALVTLTTQFRSHDTLCSLINDRFYGGILLSKESGREPRLFFKEPLSYLNRSPVVVIDTASLSPWGESLRGSRLNLAHALVVRKIALLLSAHGAALTPEAVGVITPYRQQANLIRELLVECSLNSMISAGTVHRFQGSERDTIILDLTESYPLELGAFFQAGSLRDTGARLLNVALSRARKHLFVIANLDFLREQLRGRFIISGVLEDLLRVGVRIPVGELIGEPIFATPPREIREASGVLAFQAFDSALFMPGMITDLLAARREVVFSSPTLTQRVARVVSTIVEQRIQSGLRVTLRIDQRKERSNEELRALDSLKASGVVIVRSPHATPPAVVVDSEVVWLGSISPFDAINPEVGLMTRCVSTKAAQHTLELLAAGETVRVAEPLAAVG